MLDGGEILETTYENRHQATLIPQIHTTWVEGGEEI